MDKKFSELKKQVLSPPGAPERVEAYRQEMLAEIGLHELRAMHELSQAELAQILNVSQAAVSKFEHGSDCRVSTLSNYVEAMGGRLELRAVFDDREVPLTVDRRD